MQRPIFQQCKSRTKCVRGYQVILVLSCVHESLATCRWCCMTLVLTQVTPHVVRQDPNPPKKRDFAKGLTPDVLQMFHDAQSNILELNKSRLQALEELKFARSRIQDLGTFECTSYSVCFIFFSSDHGVQAQESVDARRTSCSSFRGTCTVVKRELIYRAISVAGSQLFLFLQSVQCRPFKRVPTRRPSLINARMLRSSRHQPLPALQR